MAGNPILNLTGRTRENRENLFQLFSDVSTNERSRWVMCYDCDEYDDYDYDEWEDYDEFYNEYEFENYQFIQKSEDGQIFYRIGAYEPTLYTLDELTERCKARCIELAKDLKPGEKCEFFYQSEEDEEGQNEHEND